MARYTALLLLTIWAIHGFHRWNGTIWRRVHFRGSRLYIVFAAQEVSASRAESRPFNIANAVREFAAYVCRGDSAFATRLLAGGIDDPGGYLLNLIVTHKQDGGGHHTQVPARAQ
ncbi:MAG: hypothetical protein Q7V01_08720 [Vicinamibacterales bacterium]|nr:hypothetical protein [Vicinamibacterales bacterium]